MSDSSRSSRGVLIAPATSYSPAPDLAVVTSYFNSHHYDSKRRAFDRFADTMDRSGIPLFVGECAFGDSPFELEKSASVFRFRARDVLWQKERLLNLTIDRVPDRYTKIAWIDGDVLFENPRWSIDASEQLDDIAVVQLFDRAMRLRPQETAYSGGPRRWSYCFVHATLPSFSRFGEGNLHGATGFAWAADRELLQTVGLYDAAIAGGADDLMAHAFSGDFSARCLPLILTAGMVEHFRDWAERAWQTVRGRIGYVRGSVQHLWHGEDQNRAYVARFHNLSELGYEPLTHLQLDPGGLWAFTDAGRRALAEWSGGYFRGRQEDTQTAGCGPTVRSVG